MKKNDKRNLRVHTTTVRALTRTDVLRGVAGGDYSGNDKSCGANECRPGNGGGGGGTDLM
jgi:hypothetical protein